MARFCELVLVLSLAAAHVQAIEVRGALGANREQSLLQTYNAALTGNGGKVSDTPVTRVVNLLKEMTATLDKEQDEDEALYKKLACWCNNNQYEKKEAMQAASDKIAELEAAIESLTARSSELTAKIHELETKVAADKAALKEASSLRAKQLKEFQGMELDSIAAVENLKAAIVVLSKHQGSAFPQMAMSFLEVSSKQEPFGMESQMSFSFDEFLRHQDVTHPASPPAFRKQASSEEVTAFAQAGWAPAELNSVKTALRQASVFMQAHHGHGYMPSYNAQSGEIFGILQQMKEEMEGDLSEAQKTEASRAATFAELRSAKTSEIESGEKMAEEKEDKLAQTHNDLAEAKEDLGQTEKQLAADQKFMANLEKMCKEGDANFEERKKSRLAEIQAVAETIQILTGDEARDAMDTTFKFIQVSSSTDKLRRKAAAVLRRSRNVDIAMLATSVELDAFTKVKAMITKMIEALKGQMADEVKKNDYCKAELQENEMTTMKTTDLKADLEAKSAQLESSIKTLAEEIEKARLDISNLQIELQRASENRKKENMDFQKVVADQAATAEILAKALDKLATFYDEAAFAQTKKQTPPVAQMEYKKSGGAGGVMSMIEKLILDTKAITADSKKTESEAQAAYEALVADTNESAADLMASVTSKTKDKAQAKKDLSMTNEDLAEAVTELEELGKYNADVHAECDYVLKNFMIRQKGRAEEIESLQQAMQILNGANLS